MEIQKPSDISWICYGRGWCNVASKDEILTTGFRSHCCINVPMEYQKQLAIVNWLWSTSYSIMHGCGLYHSYGDNLATRNSVTETRTYAASTYSQMSSAIGFMKENSCVGLLSGIYVSYTERKCQLTKRDCEYWAILLEMTFCHCHIGISPQFKECYRNWEFSVSFVELKERFSGGFFFFVDWVLAVPRPNFARCPIFRNQSIHVVNRTEPASQIPEEGWSTNP